MLLLPNDCSCSKDGPAVIPKNWKSKTARTDIDWCIHYRFYDPRFKDDPKLKGVKQVSISGMNHLKDLAQRRDLTRRLLENEMDLLKNRGYNPITKTIQEPVTDDEFADYIVHPRTGFIEALNAGIDQMTSEKDTKRDAKNIVAHIQLAADQLNISKKPISEIRRRHILMILKQCEKNKREKWSANLFNTYRSNLLMIFRQLLQIETVESNPVREILKQKTTIKIRETLTDTQRQTVNNHLRSHHYSFWLYLQIFFHSGSRTKELFRLKGKHVDIERQQFKSVVKKRGQPSEIMRPIKDIALPFWQEIMANCGADDYLFSVGLRPGSRPIRADQITKRWRKYVKDKETGLGIKADFYSLKASNLDEIAEALNIKDAAAAAAHTTPVITMKRYAHGERERQNERIKKVNNPF